MRWTEAPRPPRLNPDQHLSPSPTPGAWAFKCQFHEEKQESTGCNALGVGGVLAMGLEIAAIIMMPCAPPRAGESHSSSHALGVRQHRASVLGIRRDIYPPSRFARCTASMHSASLPA